MNTPIRYDNLIFSGDFRLADHLDGTQIKFSRSERILLSCFVKNAGSILPRERLLDALTGVGSESSDRNIDFLINRLRRKLGDSARSSTFIETSYGEGYVWVATAVHSSAEAAGAFLVVGPLKGLGRVGDFTCNAREFAEQLAASLQSQMADDQRVVFDEHSPSAKNFGQNPPQFAAELSFLATKGRLDCAITLKHVVTNQVLALMRTVVAPQDDPEKGVSDTAMEQVTEELRGAIWHALAHKVGVMDAPDNAPLAVRMHDATAYIHGGGSWIDTENRTRKALEDNPNDPRAQLMRATSLHSKYVMMGAIQQDNDPRPADEDEIEHLVCACLPHVRENPVFALAAAKLLHFIDRGFRPLAYEMAEAAFEQSTAFAASFATFGQMNMCRGDIDTAVKLFDHGIELAEPGTDFEVYFMVFKCQAELAGGDAQAFIKAREALYARKPETKIALSPIHTLASETEIPREVDFRLGQMDLKAAQDSLIWLNYVQVRLLAEQEHRENVLRGPLSLYIKRFGPEVVPEEVQSSSPRLYSELTSR